MTEFENARDFAEAMMLYRYLHPPKVKKAVEKPKKPKQDKRKYDLEAIRKMRTDGMSVKAIAETVGAKEHAIQNFLSRNGLTHKNTVSKYNLDEIRLLRKDGVSFEEIAKEYGVTPKAIKSFCARNKIIGKAYEKPKNQTQDGKKTKYDLDGIVCMLKQGITAKKIAENLGVNKKAIESLLRRNGIKAREVRKTT